MYEKYLLQLEEAGKIRNLKERSISCYKNYVSYFLNYMNREQCITTQTFCTYPSLWTIVFPYRESETDSVQKSSWLSEVSFKAS